jgi:hypothetical protein
VAAGADELARLVGALHGRELRVNQGSRKIGRKGLYGTPPAESTA